MVVDVGGSDGVSLLVLNEDQNFIMERERG